MIFGIIVLFCFGCAQAAVPWWNLPNFYLNSTVSATDLLRAMEYAASYDPGFSGFDYKTEAARCYRLANIIGTRLNVEERAAVACYMAISFISARVSNVLRLLDENFLRAWIPFLKFFHTGSAKVENGKLIEVCRGDPFQYGSHQVGSVVTLPLSFSAAKSICEMFAGQRALFPGSKHSCTITRLVTNSTRYIGFHSVTPDEREYIMLPGTLARIRSITAQQPTKCRIVELYEIPFKDVPPTTNVKNLFDGNMNSTQDQQENRFIRDYYQPSFLVSVAKTKRVNIITNGGADDPYNFWPYITNITYGEIGPSNDLRVGQILVRVNEYSTRGMLHHEVEKLIEKVKMDQKAFTNYTVAAR